jgi:uncharacterized protein (TIGR00725 family)
MSIWNLFGKLFNSKNVSGIPIKNVAIFGYADAPDKGKLFRDVVETSKLLALADYTVIDGGGPGVMRAATVGAKEGGGKVIAVTLYPEDMTKFEGRDPKNLFDVEIKTSNYLERTLTLLKEGQVYVIFNGGTGTISEFAMAWGLARLYFGHHKPLILFGSFWHEIIDAFKKNMMLRSEELKVFKIVERPDQVLTAIAEFERELKAGHHAHMEASRENGYTN